MSNESDNRAVKQLLLQAITSLELAVELMGEAKAKEPRKPPLLLTRTAKQKLLELREAEIKSEFEARRYE